VRPLDEHNRALVALVRPADWVNPAPAARYNLVVIGAGPAGLVAAAGAAGLGARVALIERQWLGGDCLIAGCVPSKALLSAARAAAQVRDAARFGIHVPPGTQVDFPAIMQRMRRLRAELAPADSAERLRRLGVDVFFGQAEFTGPDTLRVGPHALRFSRAVIATGARPARPPIPGLEQAGYLTNETVFALTSLPRRLAVIGAGPIGCELAQAFARFGSKVHLVEARHGILPRDDRGGAEIVQRALVRDGVELLCCGQQLEITSAGREKRLSVHAHGQQASVTVDEILVATGRTPNLEGLELDLAGVRHAATGVLVNDRLQTSNRRVFAAGDVCTPLKFTHAADALARIVLRNALFPGRARASTLTVPWCTYTDPEIAHVGLSEEDAARRGIATHTFVQPLGEIDRAVLDDQAEGVVKVLVRRGTDRILGATVVASHAGEMISEVTLAMEGGLGLNTISRTIHPYPTQAEAMKKIGDQFQRGRLTPRVRALLARWFAWRR